MVWQMLVHAQFTEIRVQCRVRGGIRKLDVEHHTRRSQINYIGTFSFQQIPVTYPATAPEIALPELDGKTAKMYRGGKICLTDHFKPLWARNVPRFGIAHAMALGVSSMKSSLLVVLKYCICTIFIAFSVVGC